MKDRIRFEWRPLLFLLIPIWTVVSGFLPGFQNSEYDFIAVENGTAIGAGEVGLFKAYSYATVFVKIFFFLGIISVILIGIFAVFASIFPAIRSKKVMIPMIMVLFVLQGVGFVAGGFLLADYVKCFSIDYFASQKRIFDDYNALAFMNLNLLLSMAIPALLFVWWIWVSVATRLKKKKD